jgi:hypothetical protein
MIAEDQGCPACGARGAPVAPDLAVAAPAWPPVPARPPAVAAPPAAYSRSAECLWFVIAGGLTVVLSTLLDWTVQLSPTMVWGPAFELSYWTGLAPSALRGISAFDLTLYLGDVTVTVLCGACALLAVRALLTQGRLPARLVAACGLAAIVVFAVEFARWLVPGSVVLVLIVSIVGAALLVAGALRLARR